MNIQITDKYRITSDEHNFNVERRISNTKVATQTREWKQIEFFTHLETALSSVRQHLLRDSDESTVSGLLELVKEIDLMLDTIRES